MITRLRHLNDDEGISLVEVVVATAVLMVVISATASALIGSTASVRDTRDRSVATNLAVERIEMLRGTPFADLDLGATSETVTVGPTDFEVITELQLVAIDASESSCSADPDEPPAYVDAAVIVEWQGMRGGPATSRTILTPDVGALDPYNGQVGVMVLGGDGTGMRFVPVLIDRVSGAGQNVQTTDRDGCAFFINVQPGDWEVVLDEPGWVDHNSVQRSAQTVSVNASQTTKVEFTYDRAGSLLVRPVAGAAVTESPIVAAAMPLTLEITHFEETGDRRVFPGNGYPREIGGLFPHEDPYAIYAGQCAAADPANNGAASGLREHVHPGAQTIVDLPMHVVEIASELSEPVAVTASLTDPDTGCTEELDLGSVPAGPDSSQLLLLPYGTWTITAGGHQHQVTNTHDTLATIVHLELSPSGLGEAGS